MDDETNPEYINHYLKLDEDYILQYGEKVALFYQVGGFYQLYGTEQRMKQICYDHMGISYRQIKDTSIHTGGYPINALKKYTKLLIESNYIVLVYNQQDLKKKKIRVFNHIVSGTTIDDDEMTIENQTVLCVYIEFDSVINNVEMCTYEPSTGECHCFINNDKTWKDIMTRIHKIDPKQIIIYMDGCTLPAAEIKKIFNFNMMHLRLQVPPEYKKIQFQNQFLSEIFPSMLSGIEYIRLGQYPSTVVCYILLLKFMGEFNASFLYCLNPPKINYNKNTVLLSEKCIEQFNLIDSNKNSLFNIINNTSTLRGKKYLKYLLMNPSTDKLLIQQSYQCIELMMPVYKEFEEHLSKISDIDKLHRRIHTATLNPFEFQYLDQSYTHILKMIELSSKYHIESIEHNQCLTFYHQYRAMNIENAKCRIEDDFLLPLFNHQDLEALYVEQDQFKQELNHLLKQYETTIGKPLKLEKTGYHVTDNQRKMLIKLYPELEFSGKTSGFKMSSLMLRRLADNIAEWQSKINTLTKRYYLQFLNDLSQYRAFFDEIVHYVNTIDVIKSNAKTALMYHYCKPIVKDVGKAFINAIQLRHPIIEKVNNAVQFVPNDCMIGDEHDGIILMGVNSSGKSSYCKSIGISIIMAQTGMYVPAESFTFSIYHKLGTKMIGVDDIYAEKSLYINEVLKIKEFTEFADPFTLIIADEPASGTEYPSQLGLVAAMIKYLSSVRASFILTTHIHELIHLDMIKGCKNVKMNHLSVIIEPHKMIYERKIKEGACPELYGIEIANFLGLNDKIISDAYQVRNLILNKHVDYKESHFNALVIMKECTLCQSTENLITHHITEQFKFKHNTMPFHKNAQHNLVVLCEKCHHEIHANKRKIYGYVHTSNGIELQYE